LNVVIFISSEIPLQAAIVFTCHRASNRA